jgi:hypothetical protein
VRVNVVLTPKIIALLEHNAVQNNVEGVMVDSQVLKYYSWVILTVV